MKIIKAIIVIWLSLFLIGIIVGKAKSPDYSKTKNIRKLVVDKHVVKVADLEWLHKQSFNFDLKPKEIKEELVWGGHHTKKDSFFYYTEFMQARRHLRMGLPEDWVDRFSCVTFTAEDETKYVYTPYRHRVYILRPDPTASFSEGYEGKMSIFPDNFKSIAPGLVLPAFPKSIKTIRIRILRTTKRVPVIAGAVLLGLAGFGAGYYIGYTEEYNSSEEMFRNVLKDVELWNSIWVSSKQRQQLIDFFKEDYPAPNESSE